MMTKEEREIMKNLKRDIKKAEFRAQVLEYENHQRSREEINRLDEKRKELNISNPTEFEEYKRLTELIRLNSQVDESVGKNEANVRAAKAKATGEVAAAIIGGIGAVAGIITASKCTYAPNLGTFIPKPGR